ncbi:MAG: M48 family metalloprotease [Heliomarina sp.]|uniref:M48 family metalloprotease n=1 Tax=Heliomarina sp. TaxID=2917556 RepID=UPI0040584E57
MKNFFRLLSVMGFPLLTACGTTYELPELGESQSQKAALMFADARKEGARRQISNSAAEARFARVARKIAPVGKAVCEQAAADQAGVNCNVNVAIDRDMSERNAYFTYKDKQPVIRLSMPLLRDSVNDDEVAFVMSHEYGHLIGRHIEKQQQQALAGAIILGAVAAAATAQTTPYGTYYDTSVVNDSMMIGAAAGQMAYSQSYELESDTLGTRIAHAAGYDPVAGAKFFARPEPAKASAGKLSFWGTHPPDAKRVATVLATVDQIDNKVALRKVKSTASQAPRKPGD